MELVNEKLRTKRLPMRTSDLCRHFRSSLSMGMGLVFVALASISCESAQPQREVVIVVPTAATSTAEYRGDGSVPSRRYVVRMSDGYRDWEVEFPEVATGYELRIPLKAGSAEDALVVDADKLTAADKELLESLRRSNPQIEREGVYVDGRNVNDAADENQLGGLEPGAELAPSGSGENGAKLGPAAPMVGKEAEAAPTRRSYFLGLENVRKLYRGGNYEMALVFLKKLEQDYPDDVKILSMMGTLWRKVGRDDLAREYWERVLQIDPDNRQVLDAMKRLNENPGAPAGLSAPQAPEPEESP